MEPQPRLGSELEPWTVAMPYQQKTVCKLGNDLCNAGWGLWGVAGVDWDRLALSVCDVWKKVARESTQEDDAAAAKDAKTQHQGLCVPACFKLLSD